MHLYEWHQLLLTWVQANQRGDNWPEQPRYRFIPFWEDKIPFAVTKCIRPLLTSRHSFSYALSASSGFGFTVITKSDRILRDLDLLRKINEKTKCVVQMTLTTCDEELCRKIEPHVSTRLYFSFNPGNRQSNCL